MTPGRILGQNNPASFINKHYMAIFVLKYSDSAEVTSSLDFICSFNVSMQNSILGHWDVLRTHVLSVSVFSQASIFILHYFQKFIV